MLGTVSLLAQTTEINFSHQRGFYTSSFSLVLSSDPGMTIKYTTNGAHPMTNGSVYSTPISITTTTPVRAVAYNALDTSRVRSHTYIYTANVVMQSSSTPGFPLSTGLNTSITNNSTWGPQMEAALQAIPTACLVMDLSDYTTIWNTKGIEKPANFEYFDLDGNSYGEPSGVNTYGNSSFSGTDKKNYRFKFKEEYGAKSFKDPIFGPDAADKFDIIDLRCGSQETMVRGGVQNIHENLFKDVQIALSEYGAHSFFAHLYINGIYWGVYSGSERPNKSFGEAYFGGNKDDYNTMKATCCNTTALPIDGTDNSYYDLSNQVNNYNTVEQYLDVDHFINYVLLCNYGPHGDWRTWNTYAIDNPTAGVPYRFFMWDPEPSLKNDWYYTNQQVDTRDHEDIWQPLKANQEFRVRFGDNVECQCMEDDGPLYAANLEQTYIDMFDANRLAYLMEAARWGNLTLYNEFTAYRDDIVSTGWFQTRLNTLIAGYKNHDLYSTTKSATYSINGGLVNQNTTVSLGNTNGGGTIYYTTDGSDPRLVGGGVNPAANSGSSLTISSTVEVRARVLYNGEWSSMCPKVFYTPQTYSNIIINEIHYNQDTTRCGFGAAEVEFLEIYNKGNTAVNLSNCSFTAGIEFTFPIDAMLAPGAYLVLAENKIDLETSFGIAVFGQYKGALNNGGEILTLEDPFGNIIDNVEYNNTQPWDETPDDGGPSLELISPTMDNTNPLNWLHSQNFCGTPGAANSSICASAPPLIVINEINYKSGAIDDPDDWVELHNMAGYTVDISNWELRDEGGSFTIPGGTSLLADEYLVLARDLPQFKSVFTGVNNSIGDFGFGLSGGGERLTLHTTSSCLVDHVAYDDVAPWPTAPDGTGPTLSLIIPNTDNLIHTNWESSGNLPAPLGTPGRANTPCPALNMVVPPEVCSTVPASFAVENPVAGALYLWTFPGGSPTTAFGPNVNVTWNTPTTSAVQLTTSYFECSTSITQSISVVSCNSGQANNDFYTLNEDATLSQDVSSNESDPEGHNVVYSVLTNVSNGTLNLNTNGSFTYIPTPNYFGSDQFTYEVCDDGTPIVCESATVSLTINSVNDAPVAVNDVATTQEDNSVNGNLTSNDNDPIENDNLVLTTTPAVPPTNGSVSLSANGNYSYTPNPNFYGNDVFTYEVCDTGSPAACDQAQVSITVNPVNDAPTLNNDVASTPENTPVTVSVLNNDNDIDGNLIPGTLQITSNVPAAQGAVQVINGAIVFTPAFNYNGTVAPINYEVCDDGTPLPGICQSATLQIQVTSVNEQPVAVNDNYTAQENMQITGNLSTNDTDPDGDNLYVNTTPISLPQNGVVSLAANGTFSYQPTTGFSGIDLFEYQICDDGIPVLCDVAAVNIIITPCPDAIIQGPPQVCGGTTHTFTAIDQGAGATYAWNFGTGATPQQSTARVVSVVFNTPGSNTVNLSVETQGCSANSQVSVGVNVAVIANAGADGTICLNNAEILGGAPTGPNGATYSWSPSTGLNSDFVANPTASPSVTTTYTVTVTKGICTATDQVTITVDAASASFADAGPDKVFCGSSVQIGGAPSGPSGATFSWSPTNGLDNPSSPNPNASPTAPTTYTLTVSQNGCSISDDVYVDKTLPPSMSAGNDQIICFNPGGQGVILGGPDNFPFNAYQWSPTTGLSNPTEGNTFANPTQTTTYTLTATRNGCSITDEVIVTVNSCNDYPIAVDDISSTEMDVNVTINVLDNDSDPDGDNLTLQPSPIVSPLHGMAVFSANGNIVYTPINGFIGLDSLTYEVCDDGAPVYCSQAQLVVEVLEPPCIEVNLKVFLEGPYDAASEEMLTSLNTIRHLLPGQIPSNQLAPPTPAGQPYNTSPWYYPGDEGINFTPTSYSADVVDWVLISFRTTPSKSSEVIQMAALLQKNGTVELIDPCPVDGAIVGPFYILIEHRYHVPAMTPTPVQIVDGKIEWDFTIQNSYTNGGYGQKQLSTGAWCLFAGDCAQEGDLAGYDINGNDKIIWHQDNGFFDTYKISDFNMDGDINGSDKIIFTENNGVYSTIPK